MFGVFLCIYFVPMLIISVPPEKLLISDENGAHIPHYTIGPYNEGSSVNVTCVSTGGKSFFRLHSHYKNTNTHIHTMCFIYSFHFPHLVHIISILCNMQIVFGWESVYVFNVNVIFFILQTITFQCYLKNLQLILVISNLLGWSILFFS